MDRQKVSSSMICEIGYDSKNLILEIEFKRNQIYQYFNVSEDIYKELISCESKGKFFHKKIAKNFVTKKL